MANTTEDQDQDQDQDQIDPRIQLARDRIALDMLLEEKRMGLASGMLVNASKNPKRVLWKDKGIDGAIARRRLIINVLEQQILEEDSRITKGNKTKQVK